MTESQPFWERLGITDDVARERYSRRYSRMAEIIDANSKTAGEFFFSSASMEYWKSELVPGVLHGRMFITREHYIPGRVTFTLRIADSIGRIWQVSEFCHCEDLDQARALADTAHAALQALGPVRE